jgi:3-hydroxybutyryl-CoA dehydrogenase
VKERLGVAGGGVIACGLAALASRHGDVVMWTRSADGATRARQSVVRVCGKLGEGAASDRIEVTTEETALGRATFVVEAIAEDRRAKLGLLARLGRELDPEAILATTTSSLPVSELADGSGRPDRFVGLHVFNPVPRMELVELAFPRQASASTRERARAVCETLGKTPVEVPDLPGFVVNRLLFPYLFSAVELMESAGLDAETVDSCMTLGANMPMGPIAVLDFVGLDVAAAIGEALGLEVPARVHSLIEEGAFGRKAGRGFYEY